MALHYIGCKNMLKVNLNLKKIKWHSRDCPYCAILCLFLGSELGADSLDLKLELVAAYKLDLMHVYVKVVAYGAVS